MLCCSGVVGAQLEVVTAGTDMHSGMKGGAVANANAVLTALLAGMHDSATHAITVEGFYDVSVLRTAGVYGAAVAGAGAAGVAMWAMMGTQPSHDDADKSRAFWAD